MIKLGRMQEKYDLKQIRDFMNKLGFEEMGTSWMYQYDYSGLIAFVHGPWKVEFNYPPETLTFSAVNGLNGSWFTVVWSNIKSIECDNNTLRVVEKNGSELRLWLK